MLAATIVAAAGGRGRGGRGGRSGRSGRGGHINVEVCSSVKAAKYLFKYVYKGGDRAMMRVEAGQGPAELQDHRARWVPPRRVGGCSRWCSRGIGIEITISSAIVASDTTPRPAAETSTSQSRIMTNYVAVTELSNRPCINKITSSNKMTN